MSRHNDYPEDCIRIKRLAEELGYRITLEEASAIWEKHSDNYCAGWLTMYGYDDRMLKDIIIYNMPIHNQICPHCKKRLDDNGNG